MINELKNSRTPEVLVQRLGVFELRGLARELGIPSPTTKKRDELIALILENFEKGGVQDPIIQRRGRPYKKLTSLDEIINSVKEENKGEIVYDGILRFAQEETPIFTMLGGTERLEGVVRKSDKGIVIYALNSEAKIFAEDIYALEKLENGDLVELTAQKVSYDNDYKALSISLINGVSATSYQRKEVEHGEEVICQDQIPSDNHKIFIGRRNACLLKEDLYENNTLSSIYDYCKETNSKLVLLGANTAYENQILFKSLGVKANFTTVYGSAPTLNLNKTINGLNFAENCFQNGENVVLVVSDLGGLLLALDENFDHKDEQHAKESEVVVKKIISLAGAYAGGENFTLIMFYNEIDQKDRFISGDLLRICKRS